jgi:hypothetical protein
VTLGGTSKTLTLVGINSVINTYADAGAGAAISIAGPIQGTTASNESLSLKSKGSTITLSGVVGSSVSLGTLTLGDENQTGTIAVNGTVVANSLVVGSNSGSNAFNITFYNLVGVAGTTTIASTATFYNTGSTIFGDHDSDVFSFLGGLSNNTSSSVTIRAANVTATNSPLSINVPVSFTASTTFSSGTGRITLGAATVADGMTLVLGAGAATPMTLTSISGVASGPKSNLTINTTSVVTVSGAIGTDIGTFTVTNSGGIDFAGAVGTSSSDRITTLAITTSSGTINFLDKLYASTFTNDGGTADIKLYGANTDVTSAVLLSTTGSVYFGDSTSDTLTFSRGITHTTGSNILLGTFTAANPTSCTSSSCGFSLGGTTTLLNTNSTFDYGSTNITLNNVVLGNGVTLSVGAGNE